MPKTEDIVASINKKIPVGLNQLGKPFTVLVVDDSMVTRKMMIQFLKSESFEICGEASNGEEAIEQYKQLAPDLVTLDINMPQMNGLETLKKLLKVDPNATIVMCTQEGQKATVVEALSLGAKSYIVKPPDRKTVIEKLEVILKNKK